MDEHLGTAREWCNDATQQLKEQFELLVQCGATFKIARLTVPKNNRSGNIGSHKISRSFTGPYRYSWKYKKKGRVLTYEQSSI